MARLLLFFAARPWLGLTLLVAGSILAALPLERLSTRIAAEAMLVEGDPERAYFDAVRAVFDEEPVALLILADPRPLGPDKLRALERVIDRIAELPFVARTESLFNVPYVRGVDGYIEKSPYLAEWPDSPAAEESLLDSARSNPLLRQVIVSAESTAVAVALILNAERRAIDDNALVAALDNATAPLHGHYERVYTIGFARVRGEIAERIFEQQRALLPFAVAALLIALFLSLRQLVDVITPLVTAGISILWTLGLMAWLDVPLNVVTSTIPVLLLVVGSTEDIHLLTEFRRARREGAAVEIAQGHMARKMGRTVLLTFVTTWGGFLSVGLSGIEALQQFGLVASTGLLFNFVVTLVFIPAALSLTGRWDIDGATPPLARRHGHLAFRYWALLCRHRRAAQVALVLLAALAVTGIPRVSVQHNPIDSLGADSPVARDIAHLNEHFGGLESFSVVLDAGIQDTFLHARYLGELVGVQRHHHSLIPDASVTSFADHLTLLNRAFLEDEQAGWPQTNDEIAELMLFLEPAHIRAYVSEDFSQVRLIVRHAISDTAALAELLDAIRGHLAESLDRGLSGRVTGDSVLSLSATDSLVFGQLQSVLLIITIFVIIVSVLFTDLRIGLLAALPNLFPVVVLFGFMGYAGIPLNIGTAMAAAVAIGIAVDDTLHFMLRYNDALRHARSQHRAMRTTLQAEALPVIATSVALIGGFLVFTLSEFVPVAQFGILGALVIATALLADFVITPLAIASLRLITLWELLSPEARKQVIPHSPLFRDMRPWQIRKFVASSHQLELTMGSPVFCHGDASDALYLVMSGEVEVRIPGDGGTTARVIDRFGPGQLFGDVAVLANEPRQADAVTTEATTLMVLNRENIESVTSLHPFIASRLFLNLARDVSGRWVQFIRQGRRGEDSGTKHDLD